MKRNLVLSDFDRYDQTLLFVALKSGRQYAQVVEGSEGYWVTAVATEDPANDTNRHPQWSVGVVRLDAIEGLAESATLAVAGRASALVDAHAGPDDQLSQRPSAAALALQTTFLCQLSEVFRCTDELAAMPPVDRGATWGATVELECAQIRAKATFGQWAALI